MQFVLDKHPTTFHCCDGTSTVGLSLQAGPLPDMILPNSDCTKLAVANEGEAIYDSTGLTDPAGSAMIFESSDWNDVTNAVKYTVTLDSYTDSQLIQNGV